MIYLKLFWEFLQIGLFAVGGGMATLPFLQRLSASTGWFSQALITDMIAISESTPGPIGINMATYVGFSVAGVLGGIVATMGEIIPSIIIVCIVSNCQKGYIEAFLDYYQLNEYISDKESFGGTGLPKGENIRLVCERNHLERAVYLGDIEGDYRSACMAGIPFIHAAYGFGTISDPVPAIHSLRELPEAAAEVLDSIRV